MYYMYMYLPIVPAIMHCVYGQSQAEKTNVEFDSVQRVAVKCYTNCRMSKSILLL